MTDAGMYWITTAGADKHEYIKPQPVVGNNMQTMCLGEIVDARRR